MSSSKFTIDKIEIGDEVFFESNHHVNYDLYWKVIGKNSNGAIGVEIKAMGYDDRTTIDISEIKYVISSGNTIEPT